MKGSGGRAVEVRSPLQGGAASQLDVLQFLDAGEMPVDGAVSGKWPQVLRQLIGQRAVELAGSAHIVASCSSDVEYALIWPMPLVAR
jgi:hypothetical protein